MASLNAGGKVCKKGMAGASPSECLFCDFVSGRYLSARLSSVTREWGQMREWSGSPELRIQDLHHSIANFLVSIGINQRDLRTILGHYKPETLALVRNNSFENKVRTQ